MRKSHINEDTNIINDSSSEENSYFRQKNMKKMSLNEYEEILRKKNKEKNNNNSINIFGSIYKFFYITIKIIFEKIKAQKSILFFLLFALIFFKRKLLLKNLKFFLSIFTGRINSS